MNPTPPLLCGTLLAAMMAAGVSHYWTVREVVTRYPSAPAILIHPAPPIEKAADPVKKIVAPPARELAAAPPAPGSEAERQFFEGLLAEVKALRNENKNLNDQVGETNRDIMQMGFRLDTYSESFRPLPVQERYEDTTFGAEPEYPGVLPPRATPVYSVDE
ncbi:MAG: hypothetical protein ABJM75_07420 [Luteolibacter sp.]